MILTRRLLTLLGTAALLGCAGCGTSAAPPSAPSYVIERVAGTHQRQIVLTADAAHRIGIRTMPAAFVTGGGGAVTIPYSAIVYDARGKTFAFTNPLPFAYREVPIRVRTIVGARAYLATGPRPGTKVVTVGAEELFGAQTGVLGQT